MHPTGREYVAYYRVSTKKQGDSGLGIQAQHAYIEHFYQGRNVIASFTDIQSGKDILNRRELQKAIQLCQERKAVLVVAKVDRLSRDTEQALGIYRALGGRLESCDIPNLDKFSLTLFMAISDRERELTSIRTTDALQRKIAKSGEWRTGSEAFKTGQASRLGTAVIRQRAAANPNSRQATALIEQLVQAGHGWSEIARRLNAAGFKTPKGGQYQAVQVQRLHETKAA
jgi:DNA invertase Pin-like site-specific DNA recombinase